ncbi:AAA family ATPase [Massilia scottii]|uniref:AAA family ATPase n=1 Tax=Massilia scottii TaxID=3057166 RepID=UPI002796D211|nr:AAA family ATPase [Massilia sp. CCM 9029]MDQ1835580.1 AAA family ATPase [Massilia sp. CCM 9029]
MQPLAVYYDVHRAVTEEPLRVREKAIQGPHEGYRDALAHRATDFKSFFTWFRQREDEENERKRDTPEYEDRDLAAVRGAIERFTSFTDLRIRRKPLLRMTLKKEGNEFNVMQLSDGEKCMLALVGDLARRLTLLNTGLSDPLLGSGVVLIDEIDLHLHPRWQRTVVRSLEKSFPNCQFIVSTHSPQILGELPSDAIRIIRNGRALGRPERSLGLDSSEVVEEIMMGLSRNKAVGRILERIANYLNDDRLDRAEHSIDRLERKVGSIPELKRARATIKSLRFNESPGDEINS